MLLPSVSYPVVDHAAGELTEKVVGAADGDAEHDDREDHHQRVAIELAPSRPYDLPQLVENLAQELADAAFRGGLRAFSGGYGHGATWSPCAGCAFGTTGSIC